jgi:hypothetical protein
MSEWVKVEEDLLGFFLSRNLNCNVLVVTLSMCGVCAHPTPKMARIKRNVCSDSMITMLRRLEEWGLNLGLRLN